MAPHQGMKSLLPERLLRVFMFPLKKTDQAACMSWKHVPLGPNYTVAMDR